MLCFWNIAIWKIFTTNYKEYLRFSNVIIVKLHTDISGISVHLASLLKYQNENCETLL